MRKALLIVSVAVFGLSFGGGEQAVSTFTDKRDGKVYKKVEIGGQVWMAENLNYAAEGSKCYDNKTENCAKYGRLYDDYTAYDVCPAGWRLPFDAEWKMLEDYVGGSEMAGKKLKSSNGWEGNGNGTDEYGFSALSGGLGFSGGRFDGKFNSAGSSGIWWGMENGAKHRLVRIVRRMEFDKDSVYRYLGPWKTNLYSVRCVQDKEGEQ